MTIRRSVPTKGISRYWASNWSYIMPDFNVPNHSIIEWNGMGEPQEPVNEPSNDNDAEKLAADVLAEFLGANG